MLALLHSAATLELMLGPPHLAQVEVLTEISIHSGTETREVVWGGESNSLTSWGTLQDESAVHCMHSVTANLFALEAKGHQVHIPHAGCSKADLYEHVAALKHLNESEKEQLTELLEEFPILLWGSLGHLNTKPTFSVLKPGSELCCTIPFPVPQSLNATIEKEINRFGGTGVLEQNSNSEWAAPTLIQPEKTGDVRVLTDF